MSQLCEADAPVKFTPVTLAPFTVAVCEPGVNVKPDLLGVTE